MKLALRIIMFAVVIFPHLSSFGGVRHFGFIYEAPTSAPGSFELENWVTWARTTNPEHSDQVDFRHEIEIASPIAFKRVFTWQIGFTKMPRGIRVPPIPTRRSS